MCSVTVRGFLVSCSAWDPAPYSPTESLIRDTGSTVQPSTQKEFNIAFSILVECSSVGTEHFYLIVVTSVSGPDPES